MVDLKRAGHFGKRSIIRRHGMIEKDDYPQAKARDDGGPVVLPVSLRDWLAGQALAGMYAGSRAMLKSLAADAKQHGELRTAPTFAREAFECADAMLEARKR